MERLTTRGSFSIHRCGPGGMNSIAVAVQDSRLVISIGIGMGHNMFSLAAAIDAQCPIALPENSTGPKIENHLTALGAQPSVLKKIGPRIAHSHGGEWIWGGGYENIFTF